MFQAQTQAECAVALATSSRVAFEMDMMVSMCVCVFADMGAGLYVASKFIATSDLITTITPEKRREERGTE